MKHLNQKDQRIATLEAENEKMREFIRQIQSAFQSADTEEILGESVTEIISVSGWPI